MQKKDNKKAHSVNTPFSGWLYIKWSKPAVLLDNVCVNILSKAIPCTQLLLSEFYLSP